MPGFPFPAANVALVRGKQALKIGVAFGGAPPLGQIGLQHQPLSFTNRSTELGIEGVNPSI